VRPVGPAAALLGAALAAGCTASKEDTASACELALQEPPSLALGTGEAEFTPFDDGGGLPFFKGPQGGWHVYGSLQAAGVNPGDPTNTAAPDLPTLSFQVLEGGAFLGGYQGLPRTLDEAGGAGGYELIGELLVLGIAAPEDAEGLAVTVDAELRDSCGTTLHEARSAVLYSGDD